jgi:hypothetical protein
VEFDPAVIMAQSVPTAALLPCLDGLPDGWSFDTVEINQDGTIVTLDSDRAGDGAARLHYTERCDLHDTVPLPSGGWPAERYDRLHELDPYWSERVYVFDGGCVRWEFDFDSGASSTLSTELDSRLVLRTRDELEQILSEQFLETEI